MNDIESFLVELRAFVAERDWRQFHDPKNLAMLLASETGELVAEYRWVAGDDADAHSREPGARARIAAEIGDVGIALLLLCDRIGVDPLLAMRDKLARNGEKYPADTSRGRSSPPVPTK
ncbi:MAG: nucleotide pyrophosphohydrolase [Pseudomonadota bacterium]